MEQENEYTSVPGLARVLQCVLSPPTCSSSVSRPVQGSSAIRYLFFFYQLGLLTRELNRTLNTLATPASGEIRVE